MMSRNRLLVVILGIMIAGILLRLSPFLVYSRLQATRWAETRVGEHYRGLIRRHLDPRPEAMSLEDQQGLAGERLVPLMSQPLMKLEVRDFSSRYEQEVYGPSRVGLLSSDPYYYYALTKRIGDEGALFDTRIGRKYLNRGSLAPRGHWYPIEYFPYVGHYYHWILQWLKPGYPVVAAVAWLPVFIACLAAMPFLLICTRVFRVHPVALCVGLFYFLAQPTFLRRSLLGHYDTDALNVLFFALALLPLLVAFQQQRSTGSRLTNTLLSAVVLGLSSLFWRGWMVVYGLVSLAVLTGVICSLVSPVLRRSWIVPVAQMVLFHVGCVLVLAGCWGGAGVKEMFGEAYATTRSWAGAGTSEWPNLFLFVEELEPVTLPVFVRLAGGGMAYAFCLVGLVGSFVALRREGGLALCAPVVMLAVLFVLCQTLAMYMGRWVVLAPVAMSILLALGVDYAWTNIPRINFDVMPVAWLRQANPFRYTLVVFLLLSMGYYAHGICSAARPVFTAAQERLLQAADPLTPDDAVITSWWDYGHFIRAMTKRGVTVDGSTLEQPHNYWVACMFMERSEQKALSMLRMLQSSGNDAAEWLMDQGLSTREAVAMIHDVLGADRQEARNLLNQRIPCGEIEALLDLTHAGAAPRPAILAVDRSMTRNIGVLETIASWSFDSREPYDMMNSSDLIREMPPWRSRVYQESDDGTRSLDLAQYPIEMLELDGTLSRPRTVLLVDGGEVVRGTQAGDTAHVGVILCRQPGVTQSGSTAYSPVLVAEPLIESLLVRLFYLDGNGLEFVEPLFPDSTRSTGIQLYRVRWDRFLNKKGLPDG